MRRLLEREVASYIGRFIPLIFVNMSLSTFSLSSQVKSLSSTLWPGTVGRFEEAWTLLATRGFPGFGIPSDAEATQEDPPPTFFSSFSTACWFGIIVEEEAERSIGGRVFCSFERSRECLA